MPHLSASSAYGLTREVPFSFAEALAKVPEALKTQGFGVLTEINVQDTFKKKIDKDFTPFVMLGACNPNLAYRAFNADLDVGLLLPCNVTVYVHPQTGKTMVGMIDPEAMMQLAQHPDLAAVAKEAKAKLTAALESL